MSEHILNTPFTDIVFEPKYKVSLWVGIGADGKSALCNYILDNPSLNPDYIFMGSNTLEADHSKILIYDEDALVDTNVVEYIKTCNNLVVILAREIITSIKLHYKAIYDLVEQPDGRLAIMRRYDDYDHFVPNVNYLIEDSGSGFEYARYWLRDVETTNGNEGIAAKVKDQQVIADGCGIVRVLDKILEKTDNLYLYDSFENAIVEKIGITLNPLEVFDLEKEAFTVLVKVYSRASKHLMFATDVPAYDIFNVTTPKGPDIPTISVVLARYLSKHKELKDKHIESTFYSLPERQLIYLIEVLNCDDLALKNQYQFNYPERINYKKIVHDYCDEHNLSFGVSCIEYDKLYSSSNKDFYYKMYQWLLEGNGY